MSQPEERFDPLFEEAVPEKLAVWWSSFQTRLMGQIGGYEVPTFSADDEAQHIFQAIFSVPIVYDASSSLKHQQNQYFVSFLNLARGLLPPCHG